MEINRDFKFELVERMPITGSDINRRKKAIEIFNNKLLNKVRKNTEIFDKLAVEENNIEDILIPSDRLTYYVAQNGAITQNINMNSVVDSKYLIDNSTNQLLNKLNIVPKYFKQLQNSKSLWQTNLATTILNRHSENMDKPMLLRSVDSEVRAVLSNQYERYSTIAIVKHVLDMMNAHTYISNISYDGLTVSLELVSRKIIPIQIKGEIQFVVFGVQLRNSSFGTSALDVRSFMIQIICSNGLTGKRNLREVHKSNRIISDTFILSNDTLLAKSTYKKGIITDALKYVFSNQNVTNNILALEEAGNKEIDLDIAVKNLNKMKVQQKEIEDIKSMIVNNGIEDGIPTEPTLYKLSQVVSRVADTRPTTRRLELLDIAGNIIGLK